MKSQDVILVLTVIKWSGGLSVGVCLCLKLPTVLK